MDLLKWAAEAIGISSSSTVSKVPLSQVEGLAVHQAFCRTYFMFSCKQYKIYNAGGEFSIGITQFHFAKMQTHTILSYQLLSAQNVLCEFISEISEKFVY